MKCLLIIILIATSTAHAIEWDKKYGPIIGIDLGNTYSRVAVNINRDIQIIPNEQGNHNTPSYAAFNNGEILIGDAAKNQMSSNSENTFFNIKQLVGRDWSSIKEDVKKFPFKIFEENNKPHVTINTDGGSVVVELEEILAMILKEMKDIAVTYLNTNVTYAVITVPAYFNDHQRDATKKAAKIAGLNILRMIYEPTAAAIAFGLDQKENEQNVIVIHLGGKTFDVTILTIDYGVFEVAATKRDVNLGGEDFDERILEYFADDYKKKGLPIESHAVFKLRKEIEKAKRVLSSEDQVKIQIESFFPGEDLSKTLTRDKFEELNMDLFKSVLTPIKEVLDKAEMSVNDIDHIILVGGSTRIPKVQQLVKEYFNKEPSISINPDEVVAYGAAVYGNRIPADEAEIRVHMSINPLTLGVETVGGIMTKLVPRNTVLPLKKTQTVLITCENEETIIIKIYEGERLLAKDNNLLMKFELPGVAVPIGGVAKIEVTLEIDVNDNMLVTAEDKDTGVKRTMEFKYDQSRSPEEMERIIRDAETYAEDDRKIIDRIEARNELESYVFSVMNQLQKLNVTDEDNKIEMVIDDAIAWINQNKEAEADEYKQRKDTLEIIFQWLPDTAGREKRKHYEL